MRRVRRCGGGLIWRALAALVAAAASWIPPDPAQADDGPLSGDTSRYRFELWSGAQAYDHIWSLYSGATVAPLGGIQDDGVRLRIVAGYGADRYSGPRAVGGGSQVVSFKGTGSFADLLLGYHQQLGPLTVKAYAGLAAADRQVTPDDPETVIRGSRPGRQDCAGDLAEPRRPGLDLRRRLLGLALPELRGADTRWLAPHACPVARDRGGRRRQPRVRRHPRRRLRALRVGQRRAVGLGGRDQRQAAGRRRPIRRPGEHALRHPLLAHALLIGTAPVAIACAMVTD